VSVTFALVTGGGTGGHVYPALALADELVRRGHSRDTIRFVGSQRGPEVTAVPGAGYAIDLLPGRGFDRARTFSALARNVRTAWDTVVAFARALSIVRRTRPAVVVGVGGYASLPALVAGRLLRIPAVIHEADAHPGLANRIAVRLGARPAVSLPDTPLRGAVVTGNPVRPEIISVERAPREPPMVAVVGGSLGARRINTATLELYGLWRHRGDVVIHHVTGARGYEECRQRLSSMQATGDTLDYRLIRYEDHMDTLYANATVMLCRSGGMTAELAVVGMPSILVPLPGAPGDHQTRNAEVFARADAAVIVPDRELDGTRLAHELDVLLGDPSRLRSMEKAAHSLGRTDATARFADLVEEVGRAGR
jgi:UDP-N-acetylglucosamine--N-acetylmuramyl-(pentapeptide) pyrophosphoryl-undecaprenol N-acetylglucosamine transferase